ncbi:MAG: glycosyltransferase family 39 protein [Aldersonia sp.]|nr:glycosyltransferase family 39 protein [Aldersonia sp.]
MSRTAVEPEAPPIAWGRVGLVSALLAVALTATSGRYGYHRDELYFLAAARHPDWGYADQPPLVPLLARAMAAIGPESLWLLRIPATLAAVAVVVLTALLARALGGSANAQLLASAAIASAAVVLGAGHLLGTTIFDLAVWAAVTLLVVHLLDGADARWWLLVGVLVGVGLLTKTLVIFLAVALLVALAIVGPRTPFRSPWLYLGGLIALAIWAPNLVWQANNGWPQLELSRAIAAGSSGTSDSPAAFVLLQFGLVGPWLVPVWAAGLWWLARREAWRAIPVAYALLFVFFLATGGKAYYLAGMYPVLLAAGAIAVIGWVRRGTGLRSAVLFLPVLPVARLGGTPVVAINYDAGETVGWPQFTRQVAAVYDVLPAQQRGSAVVLTSNYGEAGAIDRFGGEVGLPDVFSGHNSFWWWGPPPEGAGPVIAVGFEPDQLMRWFGSCEQKTIIDNGLGLDNDEQGEPVVACREPRGSWTGLWPEMQRLG